MILVRSDHYCKVKPCFYPSRKLVFGPEPLHDGQQKSIRAISGQEKVDPTSSSRIGLKQVQLIIKNITLAGGEKIEICRNIDTIKAFMPNPT